MPELGSSGSVRGDRGNPVPYRETLDDASKLQMPPKQGACHSPWKSLSGAW